MALGSEPSCWVLVVVLVRVFGGGGAVVVVVDPVVDVVPVAVSCGGRQASSGPRLLFWLFSFLRFSLCVDMVSAGSASPTCWKFDAAIVFLAGGTSRAFFRTNGFVAD